MDLMRFQSKQFVLLLGASFGFLFVARELPGQTYKYLNEVPDYEWYAGCFGTASGNLMGYWDRNGFPNLYTGPTGGGLAPLDTATAANKGIRSMWASKAGFDGRPANKPGHIDDYWLQYLNDFEYSYESTAADPYTVAGRPEHSPDCIGDFIGLSQKKWNDLSGECDGNIDAYSFVFWDKSGRRRENYALTNTSGTYIPDIQSGLRAWARSRGYEADVFTQLTIFNQERTGTNGFTYADVKAEIDAGYPVLCFLQPTYQFSRTLANPVLMTNANPDIHGVLIYGYFDDPSLGATESVVIRTSWGTAFSTTAYSIQPWAQFNWLNLFPVRGVIGFHPKPKITGIHRKGGTVTISWDGPSATMTDGVTGEVRPVHSYQLERSSTLDPGDFQPVGPAGTEHTASVADCCEGTVFYRVRLVSQPLP